ncbi:MAG: succinate dehydrogenase / fumarate reductase, cytochrome b subunit [Bacteroidota bacterium]|nr:succinate dehydrogenase / fumarate reductase, cytochrome b subunit [Bacteroidota bacterium]
MGLFTYLKSTILSKFVMALTGVILVAFITGHTVGNMQIFLGRDTFNTYAHFLQSLGELLWVIRIVLILSLIFHIITSVKLKLQNYSATPQKYEVKRYIKATLTGRTMIWTGIMVFAFLVYHLLHFTVGITDPENFNKQEYFRKDAFIIMKQFQGHVMPHPSPNSIMIDNNPYSKLDNIAFERHDVYYGVVKGFRQPLVTLFYVIGVILMGFHLSHAIQSMFQTLGINNPKYNGFLRGIGPALSTIIVVCLISIPVSILLGLVGGFIV